LDISPLNSDASKRFSAGVIGASGIGSVHVRELVHAGAANIAICGRTQDSATTTADRLSKSFGVSIAAMGDVTTLAALFPDVVSVCSPNAMHLHHASVMLRCGAHVLVEKPLHWDAALTSAENVEACRRAFGQAEGRLAVNYPTATLAEAFRSVHVAGPSLRRFDFRYHTRGRYVGDMIAIDLLPHALSLLFAIAGWREEPTPLALVNVTIERNDVSWKCRFIWRQIECAFDFAQDVNAARSSLAFAVDGRWARRRQVDSPGGPMVSLEIDDHEPPVPTINPMRQTIGHVVRTRGVGGDFIAEEDTTMGIMTLLAALVGS
jgi:hypothetical protein